jgi:hypothetical protein
MGCDLRMNCPYFNEGAPLKPRVREMYRARYCNSEYTECARYLVYLNLGRENVPLTLAPGDRLRALTLVRHAGQVPPG